MSGLCGWFVNRGAETPGEECILAMGDALRSNRDPELTLIRDSGWNLGVCAHPANVSMWRDGSNVAVIVGNPTTESAPIGKRVEEIGMAATCAKSYEESGHNFLRELNGAFLLIVHLGERDKTLIAIDKLGIQPAAYGLCENGVVFASKLDVLSRCTLIDTEIDRQALFDYLYFHNIPSPNTAYKNIKKLAPAGFVELSREGLNVSTYWEPEFSNEQQKFSVSSLKDGFLNALRDSVRDQIGSENDIGCFLSGGTDSSTLMGILRDVTGERPRSYSIGFDVAGFDEMEYARIAARHFDSEQHEYYVTPADIVELVPRIGAAYGEPFGNSSVIPTFFCARMARADGVEKLLGGDGGDELFGGNERYAKQVLFSYYLDVPASLRKNIIEPVVNGFPFGEKIVPVRKARRYVEQALTPMPDRLQAHNYLQLIGYERILEPDFLAAIDRWHPWDIQRDWYSKANTENLINKMSALDLKFTLADNDLPKVSRMCELNDIDVAYPFLSHHLLKFALQLPPSLKVNKLRLRYFFKQALRDFLPVEIIKKQKHGFGLPFGDWLVSHQNMRELAFDSLNGLKRRDIVSPVFIDELQDRLVNEHPNYYGGLVWVLMILEQWFESK